MRSSSTKNSMIIGISIVLGASLLSVGVSNAAGSTIKACAKKSGGAMRLIDATKKCKKSERTLTWGTQGDAGATGATGAIGATGSAGSSPIYAYAYVALSGSLNSTRSYNIASSSRISTGYYEVEFQIPTDNCLFNVTPGSPGKIPYVALTYTNGPSKVGIEVLDLSGTNANSSFMLSAICN